MSRFRCAPNSLEDWNKHKAVSVDLVVGGMLWGLKGQAEKLERTNLTVGLGEWDTGEDNAPIPPRAWLLGITFCRRFLSGLLADGSVGKTALRIAQLLALATGRPLTEEHVFRCCRVLLVSLGNDRDELRRRVRAAMLHHGVKREDCRSSRSSD